MKTRRGTGRWLFAVLGLLFTSASCGGGTKETPSVVYRRLEGEPKTLNPILATTEAELAAVSLVSRNLLDYDKNLNLVSGLAQSVEPDADHLVYTIKLRPNQEWEDGSEVTSDDVVATLTILNDPKTPSPNRKGFFDGFVKAEAVDGLTSRVTFKTASVSRRDAFNVPLLPKALYAGQDVLVSPHNRKPFSNGPYRILKWEPGRSIELVRNAHFAGEPAPAERLVFRIVPDSAAAFQALLKGELHDTRLTFPQKEELDRFGKGPEAPARVLLYPELAYTYIGWNNRLELFREAAIRRALTQLIDREGIARNLYGGTARPANGPLPPGLWPYDPSIPPLPLDAAGAEAALDAAGFKKGKDGIRIRAGQRFSFELTLGSGSDIQRQIAETVQDAYRRAGIEMTLRPMEWSAFTARVDAGEFEACLLAMSLDPNPDLFISWHSSQVPPKGWNFCFYKNREADQLIDQIKVTFDRPKARELYSRLVQIMNNDQPATFLHNVSVKWGISKRVEGVEASPLGLSLFWPGAASWRPVRVSKPV